MSKKLKISIILLLIIFSVIIVVITYLLSRDNPNAVFRNYIAKNVAINSFTSREKYTGTGSEITGDFFYDIKNKQIIATGVIKCEAKLSLGDVSFDLSFQSENEKNFVRVDNVSGEVSGTEGEAIDLAGAYQNAKGSWYALNPDNEQVKTMLSNDVLVSNSAMIAPTMNAQKITNALIDKGVFTFSSSSREGDDYIFDFSADREKYLDVLNEFFPNLDSPDLILDKVFENSDKKNSTIRVKKDGTLINEKVSTPNLCPDFVEYFTGETPTGLSNNVTGSNYPVSSSKTTPKPINTSRTTDDMFAEDLVY